MKKTLSQKQIEFARMISRLLFYAEAIGIPVKVIEWYRSRERQRKLYKAGLSRTLWGKHPKGLAVDLGIIRNRCYIGTWKQYEPLGRFWEAMGGTWGGRWDMSPKPGKQRDAGHFEYKE